MPGSRSGHLSQVTGKAKHVHGPVFQEGVGGTLWPPTSPSIRDVTTEKWLLQGATLSLTTKSVAGSLGPPQPLGGQPTIEAPGTPDMLSCISYLSHLLLPLGFSSLCVSIVVSLNDDQVVALWVDHKLPWGVLQGEGDLVEDGTKLLQSQDPAGAKNPEVRPNCKGGRTNMGESYPERNPTHSP